MPGVIPRNPYGGQRATLVTLHHKDRVLAPLLEAALGVALETLRDVDTDALGTFTRDVPRHGTQLETARRKAQLAIERRGGTLGLGSEGSFIPGPLGLGSWNVEYVLMLDVAHGVEIVGRAQGPTLHLHGLVSSEADLRAFALRAEFPEHALVLRPDGPDGAPVAKGLSDWDGLAAAFDEMQQRSPSRAVFVEHDLRADRHPTRMRMIARAGEDLVERLRTPCAACDWPGFGWSSTLRGLACAACGTATDLPYADRFDCVRCPHSETRNRDGPSAADPARCPRCNP